MTISYQRASHPVRPDLIEAHTIAWARIASAGTWFDGKTRVAISAESRNALECSVCRRRKAALSPFAIDGQHESLGSLPDVLVDVIHRVVTDPGRLTRTWFEQVTSAGLTDAEYVEAVGVIVATVSTDMFCRAIGVPLHPLPDPVPGEPHRRRPSTAHQRGEAWVALIHQKDLLGPLDTPEEKALAEYWGGNNFAYIRRALSLVPEEALAWFRLAEILYLPGKWMRDFSREFRAITHAQIELIAGRVSVLNGCFY